MKLDWIIDNSMWVHGWSITSRPREYAVLATLKDKHGSYELRVHKHNGACKLLINDYCGYRINSNEFIVPLHWHDDIQAEFSITRFADEHRHGLVVRQNYVDHNGQEVCRMIGFLKRLRTWSQWRSGVSGGTYIRSAKEWKQVFNTKFDYATDLQDKWFATFHLREVERTEAEARRLAKLAKAEALTKTA